MHVLVHVLIPYDIRQVIRHFKTKILRCDTSSRFRTYSGDF